MFVHPYNHITCRTDIHFKTNYVNVPLLTEKEILLKRRDKHLELIRI